MRPVYQKIVAATFIVACSFFASAHPSFAFGLSPPEVSIAQTLSATSTVSESVGLQRGEGEVGSLVFSVGFHGECAGCIQGANTVVMGPGQDSVEYDFTVAPAGASAGSYRQYIAFLLETVSSDGDASGNAVQRGVTATVKFTVTGESSDGGGSSGGGGGGSSGGGGSGSTDAGTSEPSTDTTSPTDTTDTTSTTDAIGTTDTADTTGATDGTEPLGDGVTATTTEAPAEPEPVSLFPYPTAGDWQDEIGTTVEPTTSETSAPAAFSFDQNADAIIDGSDFTALADAYFSGSCSSACDANGDGASDLSDVVLLSGRISSEGRTEAVPPVMPGPPLAEDAVRLYFERGGEVGHYQFSPAAAEIQPEDLVTFYLLADTGPNGILAGDITFHFDPRALSLVGVSRIGSIFPNIRGAFEEDEFGLIRFVGATNDPFVGTRGYIAAFQFRPIAEGNMTLAFETTDVRDGNVAVPPSVEATDLSGLLSTERLAVATGARRGGASDGRRAAPCPCLTRKQFPICLLLAGALATAIVAAVALVAGKRVDETDNPALPIE